MSFITAIGGKKVVCSVLGAFALGTATPPVVHYAKKRIVPHKIVKKQHKSSVPNYITDCPITTGPLDIPITPFSIPMIEIPVSAEMKSTKQVIASVPEPTTWVSMITGFFLIGHNIRKSNAKKLITSV